jgi:hypothetical protein
MGTEVEREGVELDERRVEVSGGGGACGAREGVGRHITFASSSISDVDTTRGEEVDTVPTVPDDSKPHAKRRRQRSVGGNALLSPDLTPNAPFTGEGELVIMGVRAGGRPIFPSL